jgi:hypothetical protein
MDYLEKYKELGDIAQKMEERISMLRFVMADNDLKIHYEGEFHKLKTDLENVNNEMRQIFLKYDRMMLSRFHKMINNGEEDDEVMAWWHSRY